MSNVIKPQFPRKDHQPIDIPDVPMNGPIEMAITVHCMLPDNKPGRLTMTLPTGVFPTAGELNGILDNCLVEERPGTTYPIGTRLMTKPEFWAHITKREAGQALPLNGNPEFVRKDGEIEKSMVIDAICGRGVPDLLREEYFRAELLDAPGDEEGADWAWNRYALEQLELGMLMAIYRRNA